MLIWCSLPIIINFSSFPFLVQCLCSKKSTKKSQNYLLASFINDFFASNSQVMFCNKHHLNFIHIQHNNKTSTKNQGLQQLSNISIVVFELKGSSQNLPHPSLWSDLHSTHPEEEQARSSNYSLPVSFWHLYHRMATDTTPTNSTKSYNAMLCVQSFMLHNPSV